MGYGKLTAIAASLVLSLGLAACGGGGGSSGGPDPAETQRSSIAMAIGAARAAVEGLDEGSTQMDVDAAETAIGEAEEAVAVAGALSDAERANYRLTISLLAGDIAPARERIAMALRERAGRLYSSLAGPGIGAIEAAVRRGAAPVLSGTVLGTPPKTVNGLAPRPVPGGGSAAGGWTGGTYSASDEAAGTVDRVAFHADIEPPGTRPFGGEGGRYTLAGDGRLAIGAGTDATLIASSSFPTGAGIRTHRADEAGVARVAGTFDSAEGAYECSPAEGSPCTSSLKHGGGFTLAGGGGWAFRPAAGAVVAEPDAAYRYFGWWLRESAGAYFIGTFHAGAGGISGEFTGLGALQGPAVYRGPAAGLFAIAREDGASSGAWAATARLTAQFGDTADLGTVSGAIEGFTVDGDRMPWTVALGSAGIGADGAIAASGADAARTVWSIGGDPGAAPGGTPPIWRGQFHEAGTDRVPLAATGTFEASHGDSARMIGTFGTSRTE